MSSETGFSGTSQLYESLYFDYIHHDFVIPAEMKGENQVHPVVIAGAGPVGLTLALDLAKRGIEVLVLEEDDTVNRGSRAVGLARRSIEIFERLGAGESVVATGVSWRGGQSYYRDKLVLDFQVQQDARLKHPPMISIAQCQIEQYLFEELEKYLNVSIRWASRVKSVAQTDEVAIADIETQSGRYKLKCQWLVGCDGGRSAVRSALGLKLEGSSYEGRYLIVDIQMKSKEPAGRRVWFDPPEFPGATIIMHKQPHDIWRIDYQLSQDESLEEEIQPQRVRDRVGRFLVGIGETAEWAIDWISPYRAHSLTLEKYRHGRVLFAGDAAHLVPIFGARGMNGGIDDANNLGWKLAYVVSGKATASLLDTYSIERVDAARQNMAFAEKSTRFMTPPTRGHLVMQEAVLSLAVAEPFVRELINPRQVTEIGLTRSAVVFSEDTSPGFASGPAPGTVCPNLPYISRGESGFLQAQLGSNFSLLIFGGDANESRLATKFFLTKEESAGCISVRVVPIDAPELCIAFGATDGAAYLVRPDGHVAARWKKWTATDIWDRLVTALQSSEESPC